MKRITLITGGARSGKSRRALELAMPYRRRAFVATAVAFDKEMTERIGRHRAERGRAFQTVEAPVDLAGALRGLPAGTQVAVIDCLTVWLGNLMHKHRGRGESFSEIEELLEVLAAPPCDVIVVTNEVGLGIVPATPLGRRFRDAAGRLNERVARVAGEVCLMVSGLPLLLKKGKRGKR